MKKIIVLSALLLIKFGALAQSTYPQILKIDTHVHVDVPMEQKDMPGIADSVKLRTAMQKAGMDAICMTFAVDYVQLKYKGHAWERFNHALDGQDMILQNSNMKRAMNALDIKKAKQMGEPIVVQSVEGGHFLEGDISRIQQAYRRGLRVFCLLHDNDASPALGDVYTNKPQYGGLTLLGAATIRECERLGILVDLAHADSATIAGALKVAKKPVIITHTGLRQGSVNTNDPFAKNMAMRQITAPQAQMVAKAGGVIGVWPHMMETPEQYADAIKAMVNVVGIDHVCIGTDTKITPEIHEWEPRPEMKKQFENSNEGSKQGPNEDMKKKFMQKKDPNASNHVFASEKDNFYSSVIRCLIEKGFKQKDIKKICAENFLRIFDKATKK